MIHKFDDETKLKFKYTLFGIALTVVSVISFWTVMNSDILYKVIRYPEAVRATSVRVEVSKQ